MKIDEMTKAEKVLAILMYRNALRNDRQAYEFQLCAYGLGIDDDEPIAADFGQEPTGGDYLQNFLNGLLADDEEAK